MPLKNQIAKDSRFRIPPVTHAFVVDLKDDYLCGECRQPRALHCESEPEIQEAAPVVRPTAWDKL